MLVRDGWLIDETRPLTEAHLEDLDRELADAGPRARSARSVPTLAVSLHDVVIHDTRKWFGEADIRIDGLVVSGYGEPADPRSFYMPKTQTFARVTDGDRLPIGDGGLLMFHGPASHFVDLMILVSRDRKDTDDLATLLSSRLGSTEVKGVVGALVGLTVAAPPVAAVTAALSAASVLGELSYRLLRSATGATIGLYRNSHLQYRDGFGIGRHPPRDVYRVNDLSFRYEDDIQPREWQVTVERCKPSHRSIRVSDLESTTYKILPMNIAYRPQKSPQEYCRNYHGSRCKPQPPHD